MTGLRISQTSSKILKARCVTYLVLTCSGGDDNESFVAPQRLRACWSEGKVEETHVLQTWCKKTCCDKSRTRYSLLIQHFIKLHL